MAKDRVIDLTKDVRVSSDIPTARAASVFLIAFGLIIGIIPQMAENRQELGLLVQSGLLLAGMGLFGGGIIIGNVFKRTDVYFRRTDNSLSIVRKGWFSFRREIETCSCKEIQSVECETSADSSGTPIYQLNLKTRTGKLLPVTSKLYAGPILEEHKTALTEAIFNNGVGLSRIQAKEAETRKIPGPVLLVVTMVIALPFLAGLAGQHANFSQLSLPAGPPDPSTIEQLKSLASGVLDPAEKILWVGQPEVGRETALKQWIMIPFSIVWTLFSILWTYLAFRSAAEEKNLISYVAVLFGLPFVFIGLAMLCTPYFSRQQDLNTVYALTDRGAIRIIDRKAHRLVNYDSPDFGPVEVTRYKPERADLLFVKNASEKDRHPYGGFYGVQAADSALQILETHAGKSREKNSTAIPE